MKKIINYVLTITIVFLGITSCNDETTLVERMDSFEGRLISLEKLSSQLNTNITALQTALSALQNNDYVTSIVEVKEGVNVVGYTLTFSKSGSTTIYHGKNGTDGITPIIGVKLFADGSYYWTLNNEWVTDENGDKLRANGLDGKAPQLKIDSGNWFLSLDNGTTWANLGRATGDDGKDGDSFFKDVNQDDDYVYLILANGTVITIPKEKKLSISFEEEGNISITAGATKALNYTISGATEKTIVKVIGQNGWSAKVTPTNNTTGKIMVTAPNPLVEDEIIVLVYDGKSKTIMSSINFITGTITVASQIYSLPKESTTVVVNVDANIDYLVDIPQEAKSWISVESIGTRSIMRYEKITFKMTLNSGPKRNAKVTIRNNMGVELKTIAFYQQGNNDSNSSTYINVLTPGTLSTLISEEQMSTIDALTITGEINLNDFKTIRLLKNLHYLDISEIQLKTLNEGMLSEIQNLKTILLPYSLEVINSKAFWNCSGLTSIAIPESVTSIGEQAFTSCSGLTSITLPNSVISIGEYAFTFCSGLTSITLPNNVTSIGASTFSYCSRLTSIAIPESVTSIGEEAFLISGLTSITLPNSVTSIGSKAFYGCLGLTAITLPNSVTSIGDDAFYGCSGLNSITLSDGITSISNNAFYGCKSLTSIAIPESVTRIGSGAFSYCSGLTSITIPESVTIIGNNAFCECYELTSIAIPESVTNIGSNAFSYCYGLTSITLPNSVTSIGASAFANCFGLTSITLPNSVTSIGDYTFYGCKSLTSIAIPESVTRIGSRAFGDCTKLATIIIPEGVTKIESYTLSGCTALTSVTIPNSVTSIGVYAFEKCSGLTSISMPNSLNSIDDKAFVGCSRLTSVVIPNNVTSIGVYAFEKCSGLTSITISKSISTIGINAFLGCTNIKEVNMKAFNPTPGNGDIPSISTIKLYIPVGTKNKYQNHPAWNNFYEYIEV